MTQGKRRKCKGSGADRTKSLLFTLFLSLVFDFQKGVRSKRAAAPFGGVKSRRVPLSRFCFIPLPLQRISAGQLFV